MLDLDALEIRVADLDQRLRPIAKRKIDIADPDWLKEIRRRPLPLDEAEIRPETEAVMEELAGAYLNSDDRTRVAIRQLFGRHKSFEWAATVRPEPDAAANFLMRLVVLSMKDHGSDTRDTIVAAQELCKQAREAGVEISPILVRVAELSSDENKYGMGSMRTILQREVERLSKSN